jgi:hypothetical protein
VKEWNLTKLRKEKRLQNKMFPILSEVLLIFPYWLTIAVYSEILLTAAIVQLYAIYQIKIKK